MSEAEPSENERDASGAVTRRECRAWAVQLLYQLDFNPPKDLNPDAMLEEFWGRHDAPAHARAFTESLVRGVWGHRGELDATVKRSAEHWDISRMAATDRNVIRMAAFEILYLDDIPPAVSINEAVEISNDFNDDDSGKFVNGVLDRIRKEQSAPSEAS